MWKECKSIKKKKSREKKIVIPAQQGSPLCDGAADGKVRLPSYGHCTHEE